MSFSFLDAIFGKTARTEKRKPVSLRGRHLRLEHLENRELLSAVPYYEDLRAQYADVNFAQDVEHYNVIEIEAANLSENTLKNAIITAGGTSEDDLIVIKTTDTQNKITLNSEILIDTKSTSMTMGALMGKIIIVSYGSEELTIDANSKGRAFNIQNSADVTLVGLNIVNGKNIQATTSKSTVGNGGAIASMGGSILTLAYSNVSDSHVTGKLSSGGGIYSENSTLNVINSTIAENTATVATTSVGGGVYVSGGTAIFRGSTIANNQSQGGGGIASIGGANVQLYGTIVSGNAANSSGSTTSSKLGGGIYSMESYLSIADNSNIVANSADKSGGGIYMTKAKATVTISNSVISDNNALTTSTSGEGGGIYVDTDLTITNTTFAGNRAGKGAGIAVKDTAKVTVTVIGSTFIGNEAKNRGGAIELPGTGATLIVKNSIFDRNLATDSHGGAIYTAATVTISASDFTNNAAHTGGAIYSTGFTTVNEFSTFIGNTARKGAGGAFYSNSTASTKYTTLLDSTFSDNTAETYGGAIHVGKLAEIRDCTITDNVATLDGGGIKTGAEAEIVSSFIAGNKANKNGGGILVGGSKVKIHNSLIAGNYAVTYGGGIYGTPLEIINCTVAGNWANKGGGGLYYSSTTAGAIKNSIFAKNVSTGTGGGPNIRTTTANLKINNSLIDDTKTGSTKGLEGLGLQSGNKTNVDPKFVAFTTYASWNSDRWKSWDLRLNADSAAKDTGNNSYVPGGILTDVRGIGYSRVEQTTKIVDMGAYEYGVTVIVDPVVVTGKGSDGTVTLTWTDSANARSYYVYRVTEDGTLLGNPIATTTKTKLTWSESNLPDGTYRYAVVAVNGVEKSTYTPIEVYLGDEGPGLRTPIVTPTVSGDTVILRWAAVTDATYYEIYRVGATGVETKVGETANLSWSESGMIVGEYTYYVYACNNDPEAKSNGAEVNVKVLPDAPEAPDFDLSQDENGFVTVAVQKVDGAASYLIARKTIDGQWETVYEGTLPKSNYTDYTAPEGYMLYSVRAINEAGSSDFDTKGILVNKPPTAPGLTATYNETTGRVSLVWNAVAGAQVYEIARQTFGSPELEVIHSGWYGTSFTDLNPPEGDVIYLVRAVEESYKSLYAIDQVFIEPLELTIGQTTVTPTVLDNQTVSLYWTAAENATEYTIYRRTLSNPAWQALTTTTDTGYLDATAPVGDVDYYVSAKRSLSSNDSDIVRVSVTLAAPFVDADTDIQGEVGLTWNEVVNAAYYSVWIKVGDADWRRIGGNIYNTTYTDTNPPSGAVEYAVKAHSGTAVSEMLPVAVDIPVQLADPVLNASVQSGGTVSLAWNNIADALGYVVYRREAGAVGWTEIGTTTPSERTYSDENVPFGEYEYCVTAVNDSVYSESNIVPVNITLDKPASLAAVHDSTGVTLTWNAVDRAEYYSVWIKVGDNAWQRISNKEYGTSFVASNPPAGTVKYGVKAHNGSLASTITISSTLNVPLQAPAGLNAVNTANGIVDLTWTAVSEATSYSVWLKNASGQWENVAANVTGTGFTHATSLYGWQEYAVTAHTGTLVSERVTTMVDVQVAILPPEPVATALPNGTVSITWNAVDGAEIYGVFRCRAGTDDWIDLGFVDDTSFIDDTATPGQYDYTVIAYAGWDESPYNIVTVTVPEANPLTVTDNGDGTVSLSWTAVDGANRYSVWRQAEGGTAVALFTITDGTTSYTDTDVPAGTYTYVVRAMKTLTTIKIIESDTVTVAEPVDPLPPFGSPTLDATLNVETGNVELSWNEVSDAIRYSVWIKEPGATAFTRLTTNAGGSSYVIENPVFGNITFMVKAHSATEAVNSNQVTLTIQDPSNPIPPFGSPTLEATLNTLTGNVELAWNEVSDATRYSVWIKEEGATAFTRLTTNAGGTSYAIENPPTGTVTFMVKAHNATEAANSNQFVLTITDDLLGYVFGNYDPYEELVLG